MCKPDFTSTCDFNVIQEKKSRLGSNPIGLDILELQKNSTDGESRINHK